MCTTEHKINDFQAVANLEGSRVRENLWTHPLLPLQRKKILSIYLPADQYA